MFRYLFIILLAAKLDGQQCPGGLGNNLFEAGDFGSGNSSSIILDPQLAPGYNYIIGQPPNDGEYTITNQVSSWSFVYETWLVIGDNSPDPNGYMMVVNASFEPGLFYDELIDGLCDNTTYEFSADIINMIKSDVQNHIDPNVAFIINGRVVLETGNIPKNEVWNKYSFSFTTLPGQTAVQLSLRNNAPGGIGNDLALDNISFQACGPESRPVEINSMEDICESELPINIVALTEGSEDITRSYTWEVSPENMNSWSTLDEFTGSRIVYNSAEYSRVFFRFSTASSEESFANEKCRFYSDPLALRFYKETFERFDTICGGTALNLESGSFVEPGIYVEQFISRQGCDSIVRINLDTVKRQIIEAELRYSDPLCFGANTGMIQALNIGQGHSPYHLDINGIDYPGISADSLISGEYVVKVEDRFNCFNLFQVNLTDPDPFWIDVGPDQNLKLGEELNLEIDHNYILEQVLISGASMEDQSVDQIEFIPKFDEVVLICAISEEGCVAKDEIEIQVDDNIEIIMPNIISPHADNNNNEFSLSFSGKSLSKITAMQIFNRWGGLVWENQDDTYIWSGKDNNNQYVQEGVYVYFVEAQLINDKIIQIGGTITVVN